MRLSDQGVYLGDMLLSLLTIYKNSGSIPWRIKEYQAAKKSTEKLSKNAAHTAATATATTSQPAVADVAPDAAAIATTIPKQITLLQIIFYRIEQSTEQDKSIVGLKIRIKR